MGLSASTVRMALDRPRSRSPRSAAATSAAPRPRRRQARRTKTDMIQPRFTPSASFSASLTTGITPPATSAPSQATMNSDGSVVGSLRQTSKASSDRSIPPQWSSNASPLASHRRRSSAAPSPAARSSMPIGMVTVAMSSSVDRSISIVQRTARKPRASSIRIRHACRSLAQEPRTRGRSTAPCAAATAAARVSTASWSRSTVVPRCSGPTNVQTRCSRTPSAVSTQWCRAHPTTSPSASAMTTSAHGSWLGVTRPKIARNWSSPRRSFRPSAANIAFHTRTMAGMWAASNGRSATSLKR